ncbi:MAG TPA: KOW motif-containing protein [Gemmataceae bacterium]|jgi:transcription antitermination factor NusG|nr:KOW motif-containing protein [Gemmataceae bacterium]
MDIPGGFRQGDTVRIIDGTFAGMSGKVIGDRDAPMDHKCPPGLVRVQLEIFGRPVPVELETDQIEPASSRPSAPARRPHKLPSGRCP